MKTDPNHIPTCLHLLPETERRLHENAAAVGEMVGEILDVVTRGDVDAGFAAIGSTFVTLLSLAGEVAREENELEAWATTMRPLRSLTDALRAYVYAETPESGQAAMDAILLAYNTSAALANDAAIAGTVEPIA